MLTFMQRQDMCRWVQALKMFDGYVSNLGRCVNVIQGKFFKHGKSQLSCIYRVFAA